MRSTNLLSYFATAYVVRERKKICHDLRYVTLRCVMLEIRLNGDALAVALVGWNDGQ